jgi:hypothetical protein
MTIIDAIHDRNLFAPFFFRDMTTWANWFIVLKVLFGLPLTSEELPLFIELTGRTTPPTAPVQEAWLVMGRRAGKSFIVSLIAVYLACFKEYTRYLAPGERATVLVIACDRKQARIILRYITALLEQVPMLAAMVERRDAESIDLSNRVTIEVGTCSFRTIRGYTVCAAIAEEVSFWHDDDSSANPADEILNAIRPAMSTIPDAMLLCIGTPYRKSGPMFEAFKKHFGASMPSEILVFRAPTRLMNPTIRQELIDRALRDDPAAAGAEYLAQFRDDIESFVRVDAVEACVVKGRYELPPLREREYVSGTDLAGGGQDEYTQALAHIEERDGRLIAVLDCVAAYRAPTSPEEIVKDFAQLNQRYDLQQTFGDHYAGEWPREQFRKYGVHYVLTDKSKSDLYRELLPSLNSGLVELLDHPRLIAQLCNLERRVARGGRDSIDHAPGGHDDLINAAAIALVMALRRATRVPLALIETGYLPQNREAVEAREAEEFEERKRQGAACLAEQITTHDGCYFPGDD